MKRHRLALATRNHFRNQRGFFAHRGSFFGPAIDHEVNAYEFACAFDMPRARVEHVESYLYLCELAGAWG